MSIEYLYHTRNKQTGMCATYIWCRGTGELSVSVEGISASRVILQQDDLNVVQYLTVILNEEIQGQGQRHVNASLCRVIDRVSNKTLAEYRVTAQDYYYARNIAAIRYEKEQGLPANTWSTLLVDSVEIDET